MCMHVCMRLLLVFCFFFCALSTAQHISFSVLRYARCGSNQRVISARHILKLSVEGQLVLDSVDTYLKIHASHQPPSPH